MATPITYEAGDFKATWYGIDLSTGLADDTFLEISPLGDRIEESFSANGQMAISKLGNRGATITMTFKQGADVNEKISRIAAAQDVVGAEVPVAPFTVEGATANSRYFIALNAVLKAIPTQSYGASIGEQTWMWVCESYFATDDPSTFTKFIEQYIDFSI
jgi:hypothetical protein